MLFSMMLSLWKFTFDTYFNIKFNEFNPKITTKGALQTEEQQISASEDADICSKKAYT